MTPRYPPIARSSWADEYQPYVDYHESLLGAAASHQAAALRDASTGALVGVVPMLIANKEVGKQLTGLVRGLGGIEEDVKEVVVLIVATRYQAKFALYSHSHIAVGSGCLTGEQVEGIKAERKPGGLSEAMGVAYDVARYLVYEQGPLSEDLWDRGVKDLGKEAWLVVVHYVGLYSCFCVLMNAGDVAAPMKEADVD